MDPDQELKILANTSVFMDISKKHSEEHSKDFEFSLAALQFYAFAGEMF